MACYALCASVRGTAEGLGLSGRANEEAPMPHPASLKVPKDRQDRYQEITAICDDVCQRHLSEEYALLARQAVAALLRKRTNLLASGQARVWACAVVYALGQVNFLSDRSQTPSMSMADLCAHFGVSPGTARPKAKVVREQLTMRRLGPSWTLPSLAASSPMAWMVEYRGYIIDVRMMRREFQEAAFAQGLIPFLPEER